MELNKIVESFIHSASEGEYWDFKQYWHSDNADLLKDIICMANNTTDDMQDGYIIFGIEDKTYNIVGVSGDVNRKTQEGVLSVLGSKIWSGEEIPDVEVKNIEIAGKEIDVLIVHNRDVTPYYLIEDYPKKDSKKDKTIVKTGVIYSRIRDKNTSSAECATKLDVEFLWKKRLGLIGSDNTKVAKRLKNVSSWYSTDECGTLFNREYSDIRIERDYNYDHNVEISRDNPETGTCLMDYPYLFASVLNWNIGNEELIRIAKWDIFLEGRKLDTSLYGVQATRQTYYHIQPKIYWDKELGLYLSDKVNSIQYYAYMIDDIEYLAYNLFFNIQCNNECQKIFNKAFMIIPVFKNQQEHSEFMEYVKEHKDVFKKDVDSQNVDEMFPSYSKTFNTVIVYKVGKTMVQWLKQWKQFC